MESTLRHSHRNLRMHAQEGELDIVEFVDVDIVAPRFVFEQFHEPAGPFNPSSPDTDGEGYYTCSRSAFTMKRCCAGEKRTVLSAWAHIKSLRTRMQTTCEC